jgi:RNA polymerase sigma-70 factor (ECF subfamily)
VSTPPSASGARADPPGGALGARRQAWSLLQRVANGDDEALREIYRDQRRGAFALAVRMLGREDQAEDVLREAFLRVWQDASRLHPGKADLPTWLGGIVRDLCVARLRSKRARGRGDPVHAMARWLAPVAAVDPGVRDRRVVREVFLSLPYEQSEVLTLAYFEGLTHREIAETLAIPETTVTARMRMALHGLRTQLDGPAGQHRHGPAGDAAAPGPALTRDGIPRAPRAGRP